METQINEVEINGKKYVLKGQELSLAKKVDGMKYVIIRTYSAGVFAGYLKKREGKEVELKQARRLWYWDGAASLSQLAIDGVSKPQNCKFPAEVENIILTEAIEIIPCSEKAQKSIGMVGIWKM
jgi:hypothetical protein